MNKIMALILLCTFSITLNAKDFKGVKFDDEVSVEGKTLKFNGAGTRKAMGFISVYEAALYVAEPSNDSEKIISAETPKRLVMHFKRWVEKSKILDAWQEGFTKNHGEYDFKEDFKKLKDMMEHVKENERIVLTFYKDRAEIQIKDKPAQTISGENFSKTLLKVFINNAPDPDLKKGLLGK